MKDLKSVERLIRDFSKSRQAETQTTPEFDGRVLESVFRAQQENLRIPTMEKLDRESPAQPDEWRWLRWAFRKEVLAFGSLVMLILGGVLHLGSSQTALAYSMARLKMVVTVSAGLYRATSMDCSVLIPGAGDVNSSYRIRWSAAGTARVDTNSISRAESLWISNTAARLDPKWQPAMEFLTPAVVARNIEGRYRLTQAGRPGGGPYEFQLSGQEDRQTVEIAVDERTFLPKVLKKYARDPSWRGKDCVLEVRFLWNEPIAHELLVPGSTTGNSRNDH